MLKPVYVYPKLTLLLYASLIKYIRLYSFNNILKFKLFIVHGLFYKLLK